MLSLPAKVVLPAPGEKAACPGNQTAAEPGRPLHSITQILAREVQTGEQRVGEDFLQARRLRVGVINGEFLNVHAKGIAQAQQDIHGDWTLIVLDEIQVRGGDAQIVRHLGLSHTFFPPQATELMSDKEFSFRNHDAFIAL